MLGQALARSGETDKGIKELEVACPEILEYQQNAQGRRDSKSETRSKGYQRCGVAVLRLVFSSAQSKVEVFFNFFAHWVR